MREESCDKCVLHLCYVAYIACDEGIAGSPMGHGNYMICNYLWLLY
jgi:hypothetical protein